MASVTVIGGNKSSSNSNSSPCLVSQSPSASLKISETSAIKSLPPDNYDAYCLDDDVLGGALDIVEQSQFHSNFPGLIDDGILVQALEEVEVRIKQTQSQESDRNNTAASSNSADVKLAPGKGREDDSASCTPELSNLTGSRRTKMLSSENEEVFEVVDLTIGCVEQLSTKHTLRNQPKLSQCNAQGFRSPDPASIPSYLGERHGSDGVNEKLILLTQMVQEDSHRQDGGNSRVAECALIQRRKNEEVLEVVNEEKRRRKHFNASDLVEQLSTKHTLRSQPKLSQCNTQGFRFPDPASIPSYLGERHGSDGVNEKLISLTQMVQEDSHRQDRGNSRVAECALIQRRNLEKYVKEKYFMICQRSAQTNRRKERNPSLCRMISFLGRVGGFSQTFVEAMHSIRVYGNYAAHEEHKLPSRELVENAVLRYKELKEKYEKR